MKSSLIPFWSRVADHKSDFVAGSHRRITTGTQEDVVEIVSARNTVRVGQTYSLRVDVRIDHRADEARSSSDLRVSMLHGSFGVLDDFLT